MASLERVYADQMRHHPYGYALYHPASTTTLRPGSVGFFDGLGFWNPIAHLEDLPSLKKHGLKQPSEALERSPTERIRKWTPRTSSGVSEKLLGFRIGAGYDFVGSRSLYSARLTICKRSRRRSARGCESSRRIPIGWQLRRRSHLIVPGNARSILLPGPIQKMGQRECDRAIAWAFGRRYQTARALCRNSNFCD